MSTSVDGGELRPGAIGQPISVVIPAYNSEQSLEPLVERLAAVLPTLCREYEVILVNDGSRDRTWEVLRDLVAKHPFVRGINLMRNYGQHNALLCGIRAARFPILVTMDDDLQNPPEEIAKLCRRLAEGIDVVYGVPNEPQHGVLRNLASRITKLALRSAMGAETAAKVSAFRAFRTELRAAFLDYRSPNVSIDVLLTWATTRFGAVDVESASRAFGTSNYTFTKLLTHAANMMTGFSVRPLQMASAVGFFFTLVGTLVLLYVIGRYLISGSIVPGFPFLASLIAIFSGAQLFTLGVIGEYLARMHFRMMERPPYVVQATTDAEQ